MKVRRPRNLPWKTFGSAWLVLSLLAVAWTFATPIGAAPDEPAHLIKAASVVRGQFIGEPGQFGHEVQVPRYIAFSHAQTCYAFESDTPASCIPEVPGDPTELVTAPTTAGLYNPLYYLLVGWPTLFAPDSSGIYGVRIISALLVSFVLALSFALVSRWRRPLLPMMGLAVALTPMVLFLNGTVNPNAVEIAATLTAFVAVLSVLLEPDKERLASRSFVIFLCASLAANMRGLSLLWLVIALLTPFIVTTRPRIMELLRARPVILAIAGTAVSTVAAGVWVLTSNSLGAGLGNTASEPTAPAVGTPGFFGFIWTLFSTFRYAQGMIGIFGWLDTPAPEFVFFTWSVLAGGLLLVGFVWLRGRNLLLVCVLTGALLLLPPLLQGIYITEGGIIWQGRYILPIFVCAIFAAGAALSQRVRLSQATSARLLLAVLGLWSIAQFQSFATALRRYAVGLDAGWLELLHPEWAPPGGIVLWLVVFAVLIVLPILAGVRASRMTAPEPCPPIER